VIALVTAGAAFYSLRQERLYVSSAEVLLNNQNLASALPGTQQSTGGISLPADRVAQTQANLARVPTVAVDALAAVGSRRSPSDLLGHSSVSAEANADLLRFRVTDHDPFLAARLATAYALAFVAYRKQLDTVSLERAREAVQQRLDGLTDRSSAVYADLVDKEQQLATMVALQGANASLVEKAGPAVQVQPRPARDTGLGFALGIVLGIGLAFLWEALDTRVRSAEEVAERLGLPLLARLPEPPRRLRKARQLVMLAEPTGHAAEAFRMLRTNLQLARLGRDVKTLMVTSCVEEEGKSTTVANLAVAFARAGERVAIVDLDLRRPYLDRFFALRTHAGLAQVALGEATLHEALLPIPIADLSEQAPGRELDLVRANGNGHAGVGLLTASSVSTGSLRVLVAGALPPNVGEFVGSDALAEILGELRSEFDLVLIDAPPALKVGDAMAMSSHVDAMFVVGRINVVRRPMLAELKRLIDSTPAQVLGFVLTGAESEDGYGYAGGYYGSLPPSRESVGESRT
jgi:Mrp family chromosome partitioning ATPase